VYPPIFSSGFAVPLIFAAISLMTIQPCKPGDQAEPVGYRRQSDKRQKDDQETCPMVD
jgi:hypothetical protein